MASKEAKFEGKEVTIETEGKVEYGVKFEAGKYYAHRSGGKIHIQGELSPSRYTSEPTLVGVTATERYFLMEVPRDQEKNYREITKEEFKSLALTEEQMTHEFGWDELGKIKNRAMALAKITSNKFWRHGLEHFAVAADYLHAIIARTQRSGKIK